MRAVTRYSSILLLFLGTGCREKSGVGPETTDGEIRLANIGGWYLRFANQTGRSPRNAEEFKAFVKRIPVMDRVVPDDQLEGYYTSPRDGQPWVIRFGVPSAGVPGSVTIEGRTILVHEQTGKEGKKLVFYASGLTSLVDQVEP